MKKGLIITIVVIILIIAGFFLFLNYSSTTETSQQNLKASSSPSTININNKDWANIELKDITTKKTFTISELNTKPILLESFAVWCPTCTKQQQKIKELHDEIGEDVVSISIDTDASEDEEKIQEHLDRNGFNWFYAISPSDLTNSLIEDFGPEIVNAPSVPVILICQDGIARQLGRGVKSVSDLKSAIESC
jgi:peroxiredoxin